MRVGPLSATLSKSGWGWSVGSPLLRYGVSARGVRYITFGIPGTGLYFTKVLGRATTNPVITQSPTAIQGALPPLSRNQLIVEALSQKQIRQP
jgi:hypothetical protein